MSAKRFKLIEYLPNVIQVEDSHQKLNSHKIVDLLNELVEENEELKHSIKCLEADKMELQQYIKRMQGDME